MKVAFALYMFPRNTVKSESRVIVGVVSEKNWGIASNIRHDWVIICKRAINHDSNLCDSQKSTCGTRLAWLKTWFPSFPVQYLLYEEMWIETNNAVSEGYCQMLYQIILVV